MALSPHVAQFLSQLGLLTLIDPSQGPKGPYGTVAYRLVPTSCWINHQPFPRDVTEELKAAGLDTYTLEGVEYYLVEDETSTNVPGKLAHYATTTAATDLINPTGGVNRVSETFKFKNKKDDAHWTVQPDAVSKYVKSSDDTWTQAEDAKVALDERVKRQIGH